MLLTNVGHLFLLYGEKILRISDQFKRNYTFRCILFIFKLHSLFLYFKNVFLQVEVATRPT